MSGNGIFKVDLASAPRKRGFQEAKYPEFDQLEIGDAFHIEQLNGSPKVQSVKGYCFSNGKRLGRVFRYQNQNNGKILVWREK